MDSYSDAQLGDGLLTDEDVPDFISHLEIMYTSQLPKPSTVSQFQQFQEQTEVRSLAQRGVAGSGGSSPLVVSGERLSKIKATEKLSKMSAADPPSDPPPDAPLATVVLPKPLSGESACSLGSLDPRKLDSQKHKTFQKIFKSRNQKAATDEEALEVGSGALRALFLNMSDAEIAARKKLVDQIQCNARLTKEIKAANHSLVDQELEIKKAKVELESKESELCAKSKLLNELTEAYQLNRQHDKAFTVILEAENKSLSIKNQEMSALLRVARQSALHAERNAVALRSELDQERVECVQVRNLLGESNKYLEECRLENSLLRSKFCCQARANNPQSFDKLVHDIKSAISGRFVSGGLYGGEGSSGPGSAPVPAPAAVASPARPQPAAKQAGGGAANRPKRKKS